MYVCICHGISDRRLREAVRQGARSFEDLQATTGVSTCCGACEPTARELVAQCQAARQPEPEPATLA